MPLLLSLILCTCVLAVLHTYVIYPWLVMRKGAGTRVQGTDQESREKWPWPPVAVLMAVHNEERVLAEKLLTLSTQDYAGPLTIFVGSDNSTDATNDILRAHQLEDHRLNFRIFDQRQGKPAIINQLFAAVPAPEKTILVLTDASVMLRPNVVTELVAPLVADERIGVVDATMIQTGGRAAGIGRAEEHYIGREVALKRAEGERWGAMIGPFGGCWALRARAFAPVPDNFLVDDFYLCMAAYERGYRGVSSAAAVVEEGVGQTLSGEFRRKVRISSGNWQNLVRFRRLWWPCWRDPLAFAFFSHKVLRWWTPFLLLVALACLGGLLRTYGLFGNYWVTLLLLLPTTVLGGLVLTDLLLGSFGVHWRPARFVRYFLAMNAALLVGFWRYLTGIKSNVWQPSNRD